MRFSRAGYYGQGIYFSDNSRYSDDYAYHDEKQKRYYMFLVFVIVGKAACFKEQNSALRMPPLLPDSKVERYDSVTNSGKDHTIIYSNNKQYPAFLIEYTK